MYARKKHLQFNNKLLYLKVSKDLCHHLALILKDRLVSTHPPYASGCFYTPAFTCMVNMQRGTNAHTAGNRVGDERQCVDVRCVRCFTPENSRSVPTIA